MKNKKIASEDDIEKICANYRGEIIHYMVKIETRIEWIIAIYFCAPNEEKAIEIIHALLATESCTFKTKCVLFNFLLENHCEEFLKANPKFKKTLLDLVDLRNHFAHRKFEIKEDMFDDNTLIDLYMEKWKTENNKIKIEKIRINNKIYAKYLQDMAYVFRSFKPISIELIGKKK